MPRFLFSVHSKSIPHGSHPWRDDVTNVAFFLIDLALTTPKL